MRLSNRHDPRALAFRKRLFQESQNIGGFFPSIRPIGTGCKINSVCKRFLKLARSRKVGAECWGLAAAGGCGGLVGPPATPLLQGPPSRAGGPGCGCPSGAAECWSQQGWLKSGLNRDKRGKCGKQGGEGSESLQALPATPGAYPPTGPVQRRLRG